MSRRPVQRTAPGRVETADDLGTCLEVGTAAPGWQATGQYVNVESSADPKGLRQVITVSVEKTQTSCGYAVPVFEFREQRGMAARGRRFK